MDQVPINNVTHCDLGLFPGAVTTWFTDKTFTDTIKPPRVKKKIPKHTWIPVLKNYKDDQGPSFWSHFPKVNVPRRVYTPINVGRLKALYKVDLTLV
jgi:hypothetical protein